jgi:phosphatidylserine synthase
MSGEWTCPFCDKHSILSASNQESKDVFFGIPNPSGKQVLTLIYTLCSNPKCKRFALWASLATYSTATSGRIVKRSPVKSWRLIPPSAAKVFPAYIPRPIVEDYTEACLIKD